MLTSPISIDRSITCMTYCVNVLYLLLDWRSVRGEQASEAFSLAVLLEKRSTSLLDRSSYTAGVRIPEQYLQREIMHYKYISPLH